MGRGRAKAKQTRVARELKYRSVSTDFGSLERELGGGEQPEAVIPDAYADLAEAYSPDEDEDEYEAGDDSDDDGYGELRKSG